MKTTLSRSFYGLFLALLGLFFMNNTANAQCNYTLELHDSYGDGWNGNTIDVQVGTTTTNHTLSSGSFLSISLTVNTGDSIILDYLAGGSFNSEVSFILKDVGGTAVYSSGSSPITGVHYSGVANCPSCLPPTGITSQGVSSSTATVFWTAGGTETMWDLEYGTSGFTIGTGTRMAMSNVQAALSNLTSATGYDVYVRSMCGSDSSSWAGPLSFTTACVTFSAPFLESFDASSIPTCWTQSATAGGPWTFGGPGFSWNTSGCSGVPADKSGNGGYYAALDHSSTDAGVLLNMPDIDVSTLTTPYLEFQYQMCGSGYSPVNKLYIEAYNGQMWVVVDSIIQGTAGWESFGFDLSGFAMSNSAVRLRLRAESGGSSSDYYGDQAIDDVMVKELPACPAPSTLTSSATSSSTATIGWLENGTSTMWNIEYGPAGFSQGSGTVMAVQNNPATLSGLMDDTPYHVYVQSNCGSDSSSWVGPTMFRTPCNAFTAPYAQNFDGTADPMIDACWSVLNATNSSFANVYTENSSSDPQRSAPNSIEFYNSGATEGMLALISPMYSDLDATKRVRFYVQDEGSASYIGNLVVGVMSDPTDTTTFTPLQTVLKSQLSANWLEVTVNLQSGLGNYVALVYDYQATYDYIWIDDFFYENIPTCTKPFNLRSTGISSSSAQVAWNNSSNQGNFEVMYGMAGAGGGSIMSTTDTMLNITGLSANTAYAIFVREICGAGDTSIWEGPVNVFTGYCTPSPSSTDGQGIINVSFGSVNNSSGSEPGYYGDYSSMASTHPPGSTVNVDITYATGYTYNTKIWVDWNNDLDFDDPGEEVYSGVSLSTNPTTLMASFTVPANAPLGTSHRMRIGGADSGTPIPCYSGSYAAYEDYTLTVGIPPLMVTAYGTYSACVGDTVHLSAWAQGGSGNYTYSWMPTNGLMGANSDSAWFVAMNSGMYVVTVNDGNVSATDTVHVMVGGGSQISAHMTSDAFCGSVDYMIYAPMGSYLMWSNGHQGNSISFSGPMMSNVSVYAMDSSGCPSNTVWLHYDMFNNVTNYTLVGRYVDLEKHNRVMSGGIASTRKNIGKVILSNNSGIEDTNAAIVSPILKATGSSLLGMYYDTIIGKNAVPMFMENDNPNPVAGLVKVGKNKTKSLIARNKSIQAKKGSVVTLRSTDYGDILVQKGATVIFEKPEVNVRSIVVEKGYSGGRTAVEFQGPTKLKVEKNVMIQKKTDFNSDSAMVTMYVGNMSERNWVNIEANQTNVYSNIMVMEGNVRTFGKSSPWTNITGTVVADSILAGGGNTYWNSMGCMPMPPVGPVAQKRATASIAESAPIQMQSVSRNVTATFAPNPSNGLVNLQLDGLSNLNSNNVIMNVFTHEGRLVHSENIAVLGGTVNQIVSLDKLSAGIYFIKLNIDGDILTEKIVIQH